MGLVREHDIRCLVDIRSKPYSRFHPQFNKTALPHALQAHAVDYTWAGEALGGRPKDPSCYKHHSIPSNPQDYLHEINYPEVMLRPWFVEGIHQLLELAVQQVTCIMCAEKDPAYCHRQHLIATYLMEQHPEVTIWHILTDGSLINATSIPNLADQSGT